MDRASDYGSEGWGFESLRDHRKSKGCNKIYCNPFSLHTVCLLWNKFINFLEFDLKLPLRIKSFDEPGNHWFGLLGCLNGRDHKKAIHLKS